MKLKRTKTKKAERPISVTCASIEADILKEAKTLRLPLSAVKSYTKIIAKKVITNLEEQKYKTPKKNDLTQSELNSILAKELSRYNKDLSFVYKNRGKII